MAFPHVQEAGDPVPPRPCLESVISQPLLVLPVRSFSFVKMLLGVGLQRRVKSHCTFTPAFFSRYSSALSPIFSVCLNLTHAS